MVAELGIYRRWAAFGVPGWSLPSSRPALFVELSVKWTGPRSADFLSVRRVCAVITQPGGELSGIEGDVEPIVIGERLGVVGLAYGLAFGLLVGFAFGFAHLLAGGVSGKKSHAWVVYVLATTRLAMAGRLPYRLMPFLDDAHRLGLLRTDGPRYQFRHAELQDHLADAYRE